ncbi:coiled-coil domain-containing protein r3hcc1l [Gigaspora margarita]|uniref:Coiled-coil domain-containing protein r3hcc1l n=1 Tax=Gigaspora margarita TaxID=4874 RepID=A0A8H4B0V4_GIGMA|nr:coiled-coil domain-containing protein r3hcc1l [Gigaspora margarita]
MNDTCALIIFEHPATACKVYLDNITNQLATIKPYESLELRLDMLDVRIGSHNRSKLEMVVKLSWIHWGFENFSL